MGLQNQNFGKGDAMNPDFAVNVGGCSERLGGIGFGMTAVEPEQNPGAPEPEAMGAPREG